jgi:hypothetical protein
MQTINESEVKIIVAKVGDVFHATVEVSDRIVHTTEGDTEEDSAKWQAIDWVNANYRVSY